MGGSNIIRWRRGGASRGLRGGVLAHQEEGGGGEGQKHEKSIGLAMLKN